jgi:hypothetical protein
VERRIHEYLLSLPERALRSSSALAGGLLREVGEVALPASLRRTRLYRVLVEATLRFLIEQVGQVEGEYCANTALPDDFLLRRTVGNGIEMLGILTLHVSPVWVLAALADLSGTGRQLITEIAAALKREGLLDEQEDFGSLELLLDGLEQTAGRLAATLNQPPLDARGLRRELVFLRNHAIPDPPSVEALGQFWRRLEEEARAQDRSVFEVSSLLALAAIRSMPRRLTWLSRSAGLAAVETGRFFGENLLDHYAQTLAAIHVEGYGAYLAREFQPYLKAATRQWSLDRESMTERLLKRSRVNVSGKE